MLVTVLAVLVVFAGALTRATFGFGEALVAMPLLALLPIGLPTAASLMAVVSLALAVLGMVHGTGSVDRGAVLRLCLGVVAGIPLGVGLVLLVPARLVGLVLGVFLMGYGGYAATSRARVGSVGLGWAWPVGVLAGGLGSAYGFHGIPVVVYGTGRRWSPEVFRRTLNTFFLVAGALVVTGQALGGLWSRPLVGLVAASLPAVVAATLLGRAMHARMTPARFHRAVHLLVLLLGIVLVLRSVLS